MPVHLFGRPAPLEELAGLGLPLIEDAAQAFGAPGIATTGVASTFSFYPTKNLGGIGDGGLVTVLEDDSQSACGCCGSTDRETSATSSPLARIRGSTSSRPRLCVSSSSAWTSGTRYDVTRRRAMPSSGWATSSSSRPTTAPHVYHLYVVRTPERDRIAAALAEAEIGSASYYATPLHLQPAFRYLGWRPAPAGNRARRAGEPCAADVGGTPRHRSESSPLFAGPSPWE